MEKKVAFWIYLCKNSHHQPETLMKKENVVAIEKLSSLRSRVNRSRKVNDEEVEQTRKVAMEDHGKLRLADKVLIAEYEGAGLEAFITLQMIESMILELVAE